MRHLYIAGVDRWKEYERGTLDIQQVLTYGIDTCSFCVRGEKPFEGEEVILQDDALDRLFAGVIVKVDLYKDSPKGMSKLWRVDCDDYTNEVDKLLVVETYQNIAADLVFKDIVNKYCPGFTTNGVASGAPVIEEIIFDYIHPSEAFKQLCEYCGWQWQVDYYKDLMFFNAEELNNTAPILISQGSYFRNLRYTIDQQGLRNRIYVKGGTMLSDPFTYEIVADGVARIWTLPHKPHDMNFNLGLVGIENIDKEEDYPFLMNYQEKYIRCSSQTVTPAQGTTLSWEYKYDIDVITTVEDLESQQAIAAVQGGDGVYEYVISDDSLVTLNAAEAAGNADLRQHSNPSVKGSFETEADVKREYQTWNDILLKFPTWGDVLNG